MYRLDLLYHNELILSHAGVPSTNWQGNISKKKKKKQWQYLFGGQLKTGRRSKLCLLTYTDISDIGGCVASIVLKYLLTDVFRSGEAGELAVRYRKSHLRGLID